MPHILIAGVVARAPVSERFPKGDARPRCEVRIIAEGAQSVIFRVIGFEAESEELEKLAEGDAVAVTGELRMEAKDGRLTGVYVIAGQILPLRRRSGASMMRAAG